METASVCKRDEKENQNDIQIYYSCITIITRCAYAQGRVKRLSPSIYLFVCLCVVKKHGCLLSYRSKIATKKLSTARPRNLYSSKDA